MKVVTDRIVRTIQHVWVPETPNGPERINVTDMTVRRVTVRLDRGEHIHPIEASTFGSVTFWPEALSVLITNIQGRDSKVEIRASGPKQTPKGGRHSSLTGRAYWSDREKMPSGLQTMFDFAIRRRI